MLSRTDALGHGVSYEYYTSGSSKYLLHSVTDSLNNAVQYSYDSQRRLAKTELDGSWTKYSYDENGRVSEISKNNSAGDTAALSYKMTYDHFGRQTAWKIKALSGSEQTT